MPQHGNRLTLPAFLDPFFRLLVRRPGAALAALYWQLTRRRVRARNRLLAASVDLPFAYRLWIKRVERNRAPKGDVRSAWGQWQLRPRFCVLLYECSTSSEDKVSRSRQSVERQIYSRWDLTEEPGLCLPRALPTDADFIVPLRAGDLLAEFALFRLAEAIESQPDAQILYGDHDHLDSRGRRTNPWFKPEWNEEMFLAQDYLSQAIALEAKLAAAAFQDQQDQRDIPTLIVEAALTARSIVHVPHILCHVDATPVEADGAERLAAISRHLEKRSAGCSPGPFGSTKVSWPLPAPLPRVSIIIPTKDKLELLRPCVESLLAHTDYGEYELLIVDNGSIEPATLDYLAKIGTRPNVRVLPYPHAYNFSAINNFAAAQAAGTFLCLLNNDTEVIEPNWLSEMMRYAVRPEIGAVGAKLLYEDGSIQHAGVVVGIGNAAGHAHRFLPAAAAGYFGRAHVAHYVTAVTAACLVVSKQKYEAVGGLDEKELQVAFNDVDFCLKLREAGWLNVYVPHAVLVHHESKSRGKDAAPENVDRYRRELGVLQSRWNTKNYLDPLHNPNLDRYSETFVIAF